MIEANRAWAGARGRPSSDQPARRGADGGFSSVPRRSAGLRQRGVRRSGDRGILRQHILARKGRP